MLLSAVAGLALGLAGRRGAGIAVAIGLFMAMCLWVQAMDNMGAEPRRGFVVASLTFLVLGVWHAVLGVRRDRVMLPRPPPVLPPGAVPLGRSSARSD